MVSYSTEYSVIGNEVIDELFPDLTETKIAFLLSTKAKKEKGRTVFADCRTVEEQYRWCCSYDFMITLYEPNIADLDEQQIRILIEHELLHCGFDDKGKPITLPHDIEEFMQIIAKYGVNWCQRDDDFKFDFRIDL